MNQKQSAIRLPDQLAEGTDQARRTFLSVAFIASLTRVLLMIPALYKLSTSSSFEAPEQRQAMLDSDDVDPRPAKTAESECSKAPREKPDSNLRSITVTSLGVVQLLRCG